MTDNGEETKYDNDTDEQLLYAYQQYFYWINRFKDRGYWVCSTRARFYLKEIKKLAYKRSKEILIERKSVKKKQR